jgi:predicted RNA binding protein YcfA (HicA-like mRNA interferase family)
LPEKVKNLIRKLRDAGFSEIGGGKGSHRKFIHDKYAGAVTISGKLNDDAKHYQIKQVNQAIGSVQE